MKTVLVPNAPWPAKDAEVSDKPRPKADQTDEHFELWVSKQKDVLLTGSMLGSTTLGKKKCTTTH